MDLRGQNIVVFDCEIKNEIDGKIIGWKDFELMGHAVTATYNFRTDDYKIFFDDNFAELLAELNTADVITGFAIKQFDIPLIEATGKCKLSEKVKVYDMLEESRKAVGNQFAKGLKLDNHLEAIFGNEGMKSGHGAMAPKMWKDQEIGSLVSYVLRDAKCEKMLFQHIWEHGWVKTAMHGQKNVRRPQMFFADNMPPVQESVKTAAANAIVNAKDFKLGF